MLSGITTRTSQVASSELGAAPCKAVVYLFENRHSHAQTQRERDGTTIFVCLIDHDVLTAPAPRQAAPC